MLKNKNWRGYKVILLVVFLTIIGIAWHLRYSKQKSNGSNVLFISIDALRADHLSCYGYPRNTTSNIDKLAKEGVLFTQAIAQGNWTGTSVASIITSTYGHIHGVIDWGYSLNTSSLPTLMQILKRSGYFNMAVINYCIINTVLGIEEEFDLFITIEDKNADEVTKRAMELLKDRKDRKFFLWLHYLDPHGPYRPPFFYNKIYLNDEFYKGDRHAPIINDEYFGRGGIPEHISKDNITDVDYYISQYDGEIKFTDEQIGILLKELKRLNLDRNTLIIITADHGEFLGEHNIYFCHARSLYDELIKVPLIISCDSLIPKGKIIDNQVQLIDIGPTILDILGIDKNKTMQGISLLPTILRGRYPTIYAFSSTPFKSMVRTEQWKLIYTDYKRARNKVREKEILSLADKFFLENATYIEYELYNLKEDPEELSNLVGVEKQKFEFLKQKLDNWIGQTPSKMPRITQPFKEETKEKLRSLGYIQ